MCTVQALKGQAEEHASHDSLANGEAPANVLPQHSLKGRTVMRPLVSPMQRAGTLHEPPENLNTVAAKIYSNASGIEIVTL